MCVYTCVCMFMCMSMCVCVSICMSMCVCVFRVERVEEGEGSSLVTISGLNTRAGWGTTPHNMHLSLKLNHVSLPLLCLC